MSMHIASATSTSALTTTADSHSIQTTTATPSTRVATTSVPTASTTSSLPCESVLDPCTILGSRNPSMISYNDVADCYNAVPFDKKVGDTVIQSVRDILNKYYIHRDSALSTLPAPFSVTPIDILAELDMIATTDHRNDYSFHRSVSNIIDRLYDGNAKYSVDCYSAFTFTQPLLLYAPVANSTQILRVLKDTKNRGYNDCEVLTINGEPGMSFITSWSEGLRISKDPGVRLNQALSGKEFNFHTWRFEVKGGEFSIRTSLPESESILYKLACTGNKIVVVSDKWKARRLINTTFNSTKSYIENICLAPPNDRHNNHNVRDNVHGLEDHLTYSNDNSSYSGGHSDSAGYTIDDRKSKQACPDCDFKPDTLYTAERIGVGSSTVYYRLKKFPDVGVIVVANNKGDDKEFVLLKKHLAEYGDIGVTRIIIDVQGNSGGNNEFAYEFVQHFFIYKDIHSFMLPVDLKVSDVVQQLSELDFNRTRSFYDATRYINRRTGTTFNNNTLFMNPITLTRKGRSATYTAEADTFVVEMRQNLMLNRYPWTNNPENIQILTDGRCVSSCGLMVFLFNLFSVKSHAVGGIMGTMLSQFSYPGSIYSTLKKTTKIYENAGVFSPVKDLPYSGEGLKFSQWEIYAPNSSIPLDFDAKRYPANSRLDVDSWSSRHRDSLWNQVAASAWPGTREDK
ncbi:hypothetical protein BGZ76_002674 [Entomortierella beljakovae]|nr:hypothetical protein BGZ76_002674 [Entomortierella beljakovae]